MCCEPYLGTRLHTQLTAPLLWRIYLFVSTDFSNKTILYFLFQAAGGLKFHLYYAAYCPFGSLCWDVFLLQEHASPSCCWWVYVVEVYFFLKTAQYVTPSELWTKGRWGVAEVRLSADRVSSCWISFLHFIDNSCETMFLGDRKRKGYFLCLYFVLLQ